MTLNERLDAENKAKVAMYNAIAEFFRTATTIAVEAVKEAKESNGRR